MTKTEKIRLTGLSHGAGWACKLGSEALAQVLRHLPPISDPNLIVGANSADDAGVYRLREDLALVQTVDFFTPVVDDPYDFGSIAVANALSDVYAMGGKPITALNIAAFPKDQPISILIDILKGGADKAKEAGVLIIGGHTIDDAEPKYGLSVTGLVHPDRVVTNAAAKAGDILILTKPLGIGIITTAIKRSMAREELVRKAVAQMATLNKAAAEAMLAVGVKACTDITGFGLLGHLREVANASKVGALIRCGQVPVIAEAWPLVKKEVAPGGSFTNKHYLDRFVTWDKSISEEQKLVLCDAQTSGGLLICVPADKRQDLLRELKERQVDSWVIGELVADDTARIRVVP